MNDNPTTRTGLGGFWSRRSKFGKLVILAAVVVAGIAIIGAATSPKKSATDVSTPSSDQTAQIQQADAVTGRTAGRFNRSCLVCDGRLASFVRTSDVWCGWRDGDVVVHVTMRNDSVEHLTVDWHPSYVIEGGGEHGAGLSAVQSDGFDAGETRDLLAEQSPEGVASESPIAECKPSFSVIESG